MSRAEPSFASRVLYHGALIISIARFSLSRFTSGRVSRCNAGRYAEYRIATRVVVVLVPAAAIALRFLADDDT